MRLIEPSGRTVAGTIRCNGRDLLALDEAAMRSIRGARIGMVFRIR
jgi:ABC-type microcin C transport system duplicated ATPase subunit YejF